MYYNCTIIDLYDRSVVASVNSAKINSELAIKTLKKAVNKNRIYGDLIIHTNQGSQYTSQEFIKTCEMFIIKQSMSKAGCPYDNAPMERFYNTLKSELLKNYNIKTRGELDYKIKTWINDWYNSKRPHMFNGGLTPLEKRKS